jgi:hypothetical protein
MTTKLLKALIVLTLATLALAAQNATVPPTASLPRVLLATENQSLRFRNSLLEIQNLRLQANLLQAGLPEQIATIQRENKIDPEKYQVMRGGNGAYALNDEGLLQFQLREVKKE